jgi:hypothetical protein
MAAVDDVVVRLGAHLIADVDRVTTDRTRFIRDAIRNELRRRGFADLQQSLDNPNPETPAYDDGGLEDWVGDSSNDHDQLVDPNTGTQVRWVPGTGWVKLPA